MSFQFIVLAWKPVIQHKAFPSLYEDKNLRKSTRDNPQIEYCMVL